MLVTPQPEIADPGPALPGPVDSADSLTHATTLGLEMRRQPVSAGSRVRLIDDSRIPYVCLFAPRVS